MKHLESLIANSRWILIAFFLMICSTAGEAQVFPGHSLGPMNTLPGDGVIGAAAGIQEQPALSRGGDKYLAVWADLRTDFVSSGITVQQQNALDVYAARLDGSGQLLDPTPIVISGEHGAQDMPQVAWNGQNWLVAWVSQTLNPAGTYYSDRIFAVRMAPDGKVLDDPPIELIVYPWSYTSFLKLASNGGDWLVATQGTSSGEGGIIGVRIAADGSVIDQNPVVLVPPTYYMYFHIELVSAQGEYLLAYDGQGFKARRFQADLTPIGGTFTVPSSVVASNGSSYYVVWNSGNALVGSPMALDGSLLIPGGAYIAPGADHSLVEATWDGSVWWTSVEYTLKGLILARVASDGTVLDPGGVPYDPSLGKFMLSHDTVGAPGGGIMMVWRDSRLGGLNEEDVFAAPVSPAVVPGAETVVSTGAPAQRFPDLAAGPDQYMAAFHSEVSGNARILVQRLDPEGHGLDPEPIELDAGPNLSVQAFAVDLRGPRVAWNGSLYLVVWSNDGRIYFQRLASDGSLVDLAPVFLTKGWAPDVEALDDTFLVVGTHETLAAHWVQPFRMRIDGPTGTLLDPSPLDLDLYFARHPNLTTFDGRWLATWQRNGSHDDPQCSVRAAFINPDGTPSPAFFVTYGAGRPDVAAADGLALFVFRSGNDSTSQPYISAQRMKADGTLLDGYGFVVASKLNGQTHPRVVRTSHGFLAAWEDMRNAETFFDYRTDVYARRFSSRGKLIDPAPFPVHNAAAPAERPVLATLGGPVLFAGSIFHSEWPYAAYRIDTAMIGLREIKAPGHDP